jgi:uncharacterized protein YndB with AHSA1/START domain
LSYKGGYFQNRHRTNVCALVCFWSIPAVSTAEINEGEIGKMNTDNLSAKAKIRIRRPPSEVFSAFADARAMSKFWFTRRDEGLREGESVSWFIGSGEAAISFEVRVKALSRPNRIVIEWENGGTYTQVTWSIEETEKGDTVLTIEESGFTGSREAIVERALDSTGGFNQVLIAAKALIEYGVELNVVADHA